jgi:sorbitol-specific phosphotransferase system component IIBC
LQRDNWWPTYIDHVGFTLISLFEGFTIVSGINVDAPGWLIAMVAVWGVIVGGRVLHGLQSPSGHLPARS